MKCFYKKKIYVYYGDCLMYIISYYIRYGEMPEGSEEVCTYDEAHDKFWFHYIPHTRNGKYMRDVDYRKVKIKPDVKFNINTRYSDYSNMPMDIILKDIKPNDYAEYLRDKGIDCKKMRVCEGESDE